MPLFFSLRLGEPYGGNLGRGVNHPRNGVVIHPARLAGHAFHGGDRLLLGLVREHRPSDYVADGVNTRHVRLPLGIRPNSSALVQLHTGFGRAEVVGVGLAPNGNEYLFGLQFQ